MKMSSWQILNETGELFYEVQSTINNILASDSVDEIYPALDNLLKAFELCDFNELKVVILGQDPYHGEGQAHGLAFSVPVGVDVPPSLNNIFKEIQNDLNIPMPNNGNLERWAQQGVLLLNSVLTVKKSQAGSHRNYGWEKITDQIIKIISEKKENVVFILWGNYAREKEHIIDNQKHLILTAAHPSPLSAYKGFFGCKHFSKANAYLKVNGIREIEW